MTLTVIGSLFQFSNILLDIWYRILVILAFVISLLMSRFFSEEEVDYFKRGYHGFTQSEGIGGKLRYAYGVFRRA